LQKLVCIKINRYFITKTQNSATFTLGKETVVEKTNSSFAADEKFED
jgi:hypothetical protein